MNEKEKENVKEAEEEEGIWVREQRKRKRKRSRRRRRREEQLANWLNLAPASDEGQWQRQWVEVRGQTSVIFFFFFFTIGVSEPRRKSKKNKKRLAGHRNQVSCTHIGVRHMFDTDTIPKMACPCNLVY